MALPVKNRTRGADLVSAIDGATLSVPMSLLDGGWIAAVPSTPGWYFIATDAPLDELEKVGDPARQSRHYNLPARVASAAALKRLELLVEPENGLTVVYSGHAKNLRSRAREHWTGHEKTGCLALGQYQSLHVFRWQFRFCPVSAIPGIPDLPAVRTIGEQLWRAHHGWPILCLQ